MTLRIHNTLTRATEVFEPIEPGLRSLNVAMACAIVVGEALRQKQMTTGPQ